MDFKLPSNWNINPSTRDKVDPMGTRRKLRGHLSQLSKDDDYVRMGCGRFLSVYLSLALSILLVCFTIRRTRKSFPLKDTHTRYGHLLLQAPIHPFGQIQSCESESLVSTSRVRRRRFSCPTRRSAAAAPSWPRRWLWSEIKWPYVMVNGGHECRRGGQDSKTLAAI